MNRHSFIAILLLAANIQTTNAQKVVLHMAGNKKAEYSTQQLDSITFVDANSPGIDPSTDPSVTGDAINITTNSATLVGYASSIRESLANDLRVGFIYCLEGTPNKNNGTQITVNKNDVAEDGRYMATIENLLPDATYYFRSFVYQSGLWFYGKVKSFVTKGIEANFTTGEATTITCFSAKVSGSVNVQSPYSTLEYGICYGTGIEPTISDRTIIAVSESPGSFTFQLRQLMGGTTYYYRPYAIVDGQIQYGSVRTFRTLDDNVVETGTLDEETLSVTSHLTIGGGAYSSLVLGVCYGKTETPTINDKTVTSDEVDDENNYMVTLVSPGYGTIHYRAYILIDGIPHYGAVKNFENPGPDPKVCVAIYETIPGYSVKNVKFYTGATTNVIQDDFTMFAITSNNSQSTVFNFGPLNLTIAEQGERTPGSVFIGRESNSASFAGEADGNYYTAYPPNEVGTDLNLRVNFILESIDGGGETIAVKGATAQVPSIYTKWKTGYAYTYIFKISDKTNGHTGVYDPTKPDDTTINSDPAGLYPITLDAVVAEENDTLVTITTISTPSITTYQKGSNVVNNNEYLAATGDIYVTVNDGTTATTPDLANGALQDLTGKAALYTLPTDAYTEADVVDAIQMQDDDAATGTIKGRSGLVLTEKTLTLTNTVEYGVDGNKIEIPVDGTKKKAAKFTPAAGTYAFVYTKTAATTSTEMFQAVTKAAGASVSGLYRFALTSAAPGDVQKGVTYFDNATASAAAITAFLGQGVSNMYLDAAGNDIARGYAVTGTTYYYTTDHGMSYKAAHNVAYADFASAELYTFDGADYTAKSETTPANNTAYYYKETDGSYTYCVIMPQQTTGLYTIDEVSAKIACGSSDVAVNGMTYFDKYYQNNGVYYTKVIKVQ